MASNTEMLEIFLPFIWSIQIFSNSSNLLVFYFLFVCFLWEVDLSLTHPAFTGKEIDGECDSHFGELRSCFPSRGVFQVFIQEKTFFGLSD